MRKADYQLLADVIQEELDMFAALPASRENLCRALQCRTLARRFAEKAHVDKGAFLRACGIETKL